MAYNSSVFDNTIKLAMRNQLVIEGKRVTSDEVIAVALHDLMVKHEKIINHFQHQAVVLNSCLMLKLEKYVFLV
ncbi:hypothetical protein MHI22_11650 [Lysinibacillus sp. FSL L8-0312]|uniref:hypothetical protein n=1 Tax=Lysinibacillus sp. FSL L8-0312 TaxID=2921521 RepID=UPI0030F5ED52